MSVQWFLILTAAFVGATTGWLFCLRRSAGRLVDLNERLVHAEKDARTDSLTGIWNRKAFDEQLQIQTAIARRYALPFSVVLVDIDYFKRINDGHGHAGGDAVLRQLAWLLKANVREADFVARYGGDEFALLLPQTDPAGACHLAERVLREISATPFPVPDAKLRIEASAGIASLGKEESAAELLRRTDDALYRAKHSGRNRTCSAEQASP